MRLLRLSASGELSHQEYLEDTVPPYAILSHTWGQDDEEVSFKDIENRSYKGKTGYKKIKFCGQQAHRDDMHYFWVDTCCIDKANLSELSEAITSMFRWYRNAVKCYVYLSDVSTRKRKRNSNQTWKSAFQTSRWFTRGWTLQELIAPKSVQFFSHEQELLGNRNTLEQQIHEITDIPIQALRGAPLSDFNVNDRLRWAEKRKTKRIEDRAYCLLGILDISMTPRYGEGNKAFDRLKRKVNKCSGITIDEIDALVRNHYTSSGCLTIERLSGESLPMESCFINLGIIDHTRDGDVERLDDDSDSSSAIRHQISKFSLDARLKVETPPQAKQVSLQTLFTSRKRPDGRIVRPNRVLIWGRAGIGKTTLCKKIIHDFINKKLWNGLYDRVFWLPLRRLKLIHNEPNTIGEVLQKEYFSNTDDRLLVASVLQKALESHSGRTLFILDGLDEVSYVLDPEAPMGNILRKLLNQDNVIITSRPHNTIVLNHMTPDLQLETIGFFPEQVEEYLCNETEQTGTLERSRSERSISEIRSFIRSHPLIQSLVRIPVQLDAICYVWGTEQFPKDNITMTTLYQAITRRLWEKDIIRLDKKRPNGGRILRQQIQDCPGSERFVNDEIGFLEKLAFAGLCNEIVEFNLGHIGKMNTGPVLMLNDVLTHLSFLRSSTDSLKTANPFTTTNRTYHFIHLTFQEFFAARYFVHQWVSGKKLSLWKMNSKDQWYSETPEQIMPEDFLRREKYLIRYNIFWRFVAGMLQIGGKSHLYQFFKVLEGEPHDLLGPTHQRLTIHCLSEVNIGDDDLVQKLEASYWKWILFEWKTKSSTALSQEAECPDRIFRPWLEGSDEERVRVMSILKARISISPEILDIVTSELRRRTHESVWTAALGVLGNHYKQTSGDNPFDLPRNFRLMVVTAFADCQRLGRLAIEALVRLLQDEELQNEDRSVRSKAAEALGRQSTLSEPASDALVRLLQDEDGLVRSSAAEALGRQSTLSEPASDALLVRLLQDEDRFVRYSAAEALGRQSTLLEPASDALVRLLQDEDELVQYGAAEALSRQSTLLEPASDVLVRLLQVEDVLVRYSATEALGRQSTLSEPASDALVRLLQDKDQFIRSSAAEAIGNQSILSESTARDLMLLLQTDEPRHHAAQALQSHKEFFLLIPTLNPPALQSLLRFWLSQSFYTSTTCYIWKGILCINSAGKMHSVPLQKQQQEVFESVCLSMRETTGIPLPVTWT